MSKNGYGFFEQSNHTSTYTGTETAADVNPSNAFAVTLSSTYCAQVYNFDYTGGEQTLTAPCNGYYKLEVWGAQGGDSVYSSAHIGGYGGYSVGITSLEKNAPIFINVGGKGAGGCLNSYCSGGYNGGGKSGYYACDSTNYMGGGGGATHIATRSGLLQTLESYKGQLIDNLYYDSSVIMIVAGGGSGAHFNSSSGYRHHFSGGVGGGIAGYIGYNDSCGYICTGHAYGGTQLAGGAGGTSNGTTWQSGTFGLGGGYNTPDDYMVDGYTGRCWLGSGAGGGGGFYGGGATMHVGAGGGSGYIGSSSLISGGGITKHMTCYSCTTSSAAATRTYSNTITPTSAPTADVARIGNGYARIIYLGTSI